MDVAAKAGGTDQGAIAAREASLGHFGPPRMFHVSREEIRDFAIREAAIHRLRRTLEEECARFDVPFVGGSRGYR